ncbi:Regulatory protein like [Actinidia chinensis var. chinensis]|uniref:Regulatory protein RecX n=1 Tax=Actinidia chinensis var. chinensis TaxID=1590841 RepID=A0A2R6PQ83_ACTCC|nr:Regulatory protein like [Actinidia chinensis var. chinensis]
MAIFGGTFLWKTSFGLQCRVFFIPWMIKSSGIRCSSGRANSSSFPVRYIPKATLKNKRLRTSPPMKGPENKVINNSLDKNELSFEGSNGGQSLRRSIVMDKKLQNQNEGPIHYVGYDDNQEMEEEIDYDGELVVSECIEEPEDVVEELGVYQGQNPHNQDVLRSGNTKQDAENLAIGLLATRAYTVVEMRKKLLGKRFPLDIVDAVIMDFQSRGLINDCLYAETFSRSRWSSLSWGPRRIKQALLKKGVSEVNAAKAIELVFQDGDSGGDQESRHGLSKVSMDQLFVQASKQWLRGRDVTNETRKSRIVRWLQYRGFNWNVIRFILKKLESGHAH